MHVKFVTLVVILLGLAGLICGQYKTPPVVLNPKPFTVWSRNSGKSRLAYLSVPFTNEDGTADDVHMYRLDLVGNQYQRGFDHGAMLAKEIVYFTEVALAKYFIDGVMSLDMSKYPEDIQKILEIIKIKGAAAAPAALNKAMAWVYKKEQAYMPSYLEEEMDGIADGMCNTLGKSCNATEWKAQIRTVNMLPELIKMACTAFGAWGEASESGNLLQLRALDFGTGPWGNFTLLNVYRNPEAGERAFASVTFPGFVGVITGVAEKGVGISEKVWMTTGEDDLKPGAYDGEPDVFVLRDLLQFSRNRAEAEAHVQSVRRTWGMWVGLGDYESQKMDIIGYQQASAVVYNDVTMPSMTSQPYMKDLVYVDKHTQPDADYVNDSHSLPKALTDFYGSMNEEAVRTIVQHHETGDVHIAMYDFGDNSSMIVSIGRINQDGTYGPVGGSDMNVWKAYNRPYLKFDLADLWAGL